MATTSFKNFSQGSPVQVVGNEATVQQQEAQSGPSFFNGLMRAGSSIVSNTKDEFKAGLQHGAEALTTQPEALNQDIQKGNMTGAAVDTARGGLRLSGGVAQSLFSPVTGVIKTGVQGWQELDQATGGNATDAIKNIALQNPEAISNISNYIAKNPEKVKDVQDILNFLGAGKAAEATKPLSEAVNTGVNAVKTSVDNIPNVLKPIVDTAKTVVEKVTPESTAVMQRVARIPKGEQVKFENIAGESVGSYLDRTGNYGTTDQIIEKLYKDFTQSKANADNALETLQGTYRAAPVRTALSELEGKMQRTSSPGAPDPELSRVTELVNKEKTTGLTMSEINEVKRIFERRVRLDYMKEGVSQDAITKATNIDKAVHDWQMTEADKAGLTNLKEINKSTQINKQLMDALGKENAGSAGNNALGLTDAILVAGGSPQAIASLLVKKTFSDKGVQSFVAKKLSKNKVKATVPEAKFKEKLQLTAPKEGSPKKSNNVPIKLNKESQSTISKREVLNNSKKKAISIVEELVNNATVYNPEFVKTVSEIAKEVGFEVAHGPVKKVERIQDKIKAGEITLQTARDTNRSTILAKSQNDLQKIVDTVEQKFGNVSRLKDKFGSGYDYKSAIINVRTPAGNEAEIAVTTPNMWKAKTKLGGQELYDITRDTTNKYTAEQILEADSKMKKLYREASIADGLTS